MARRVNRRLRQLDRGGPAPPGTPPEEDLEVSWGNFLLLSALGLLLLLAAGAFFGGRAVSGAVRDEARNVLHDAGFDQVRVVASGHDILLTGSVRPDQPIDETVAALGRLPGVGEVATRLYVLTPPTETTVAVVGRPLVFTWSTGALTVSGDVSDDDLAAYVGETLGESFSGLDTSDLGVVAGLPDETSWIGTVLALVERMAESIPEGQMIVNPAAKVVQVSGEVPTRQARAELRDEARQDVEALGFDFVSGIRIPEAPPPPKEQVVALQASLDDLLEGKVVEFETNSAVITPEGKALLDEILASLERFPEVPVEIAGHADSQGSPDANLRLSRRRAEAVLAYLVAQGADPQRFVVVGYGDTRPVADNATAEGRARNRRIEFTALEE